MARGPMAGVSGPGKFSKRTDGLSFQSTEYGSGVENTANKAGAPLAKTADVRPTSRSEMGMAPSQTRAVTPLFAPSERPDEPVTAGIAMGEGPGPEVLGINNNLDTQEEYKGYYYKISSGKLYTGKTPKDGPNILLTIFSESLYLDNSPFYLLIWISLG